MSQSSNIKGRTFGKSDKIFRANQWVKNKKNKTKTRRTQSDKCLKKI